jgi:pimeloyl-ACP methyl ester carboxylesterase
MSEIVRIEAAGRTFDIEYTYIGGDDPNAPLIVFLHEGLGSVAMWRDFPATLCEAIGARGIVYSRPGYGKSTPRPQDEKWGVDFMHVQACDVLPALLKAVGVDASRERPWLFGHSDGGSIALIHAALFPQNLAGLIVVAPHIFVEDVSVTSIAQTRETYLQTDLRSKLARYHDDVDSAFWGWNDIWLDPAFRAWSIEALLPQITCPLLAMQGVNDEYGTMAQIDGIARAVRHTQLVKLADCGHSPHRQNPQAIIDVVTRFIASEPQLKPFDYRP